MTPERRAALACLDPGQIDDRVWSAVGAADRAAKRALAALAEPREQPLYTLPTPELREPPPRQAPYTTRTQSALVVAHPLVGTVAPTPLPAIDARAEAPDPNRAWVCRDVALPTAKGPLDGLHIGVKANIAVAGLPMTCGSRILTGHVADADATAVARLRAAGATVAGLTAMDELAMGSSGERAIGGPTRNPWSLAHVPGGSSSGSAAAVAAGDVPAALGSDSGGSIRQPAACCGVVGFKPSYGVVSRFGLGAYAPSMDAIGVLARDVTTAARVAAVLAGPDGRDATCARRIEPLPVPHAPGSALAGQRIGVLAQHRDAAVEPAVARAVEQAAAAAAHAGATLVPVSLPAWDAAMVAYTWLSYTEAASSLARYGSVFAGSAPTVTSGTDYVAAMALRRSLGFGLEVQRRILLGAAWLVDDAARLEHARCLRRAIVDAAAMVFADVALLLMPTSPSVAFPVGARVSDAAQMGDADRFTVPANLAGLPALALPWSVEGGLPTSVQVVGARFDDARVLAAGLALEDARGPWRLPEGRA